MPDKFDYDVVVIGCGPAGYIGSIKASRLGLKTAVIERDVPGGVCVNVGCIPTKSIIHHANIFNSSETLKDMGVEVGTGGFDYRKVFEKSRQASEMLSGGVRYLLKQAGVELIKGSAFLKSGKEIEVDGKRSITSDKIIIAAGSRPRPVEGFDIDEKQILSSTGALMLEKLPKSILIIGSGAIGAEFSYIMNSFGVEVHIAEIMNRMLPQEDEEASLVVKRSFVKKGIKIYTGSAAVLENRDGNTLKVRVKKAGKEEHIAVEKILVAAGRIPNTENIGLENTAAKTEKGFISVGDYYQTDEKNVFAVGDVINSPLLAHLASKEAEVAVDYIAGRSPVRRVDASNVPKAVYSEPQLASFGPAEDELAKSGTDYKKIVFQYKACPKAVIEEKTEGLIKILYDPSGEGIFGACIAGAEATELIHELLLAKANGLKLKRIADMIHAHPTLSEIIMEAAKGVA
ncbi:MAG: dihydrolipoyl dehydrogenase [Candidatus Aureabacteria bacterium]|nr:dihydrolipoyl dehydrogenase [Candidatus Auribacterota bacterium]